MKFGRVNAVDHITFRLPDLPEVSEREVLFRQSLSGGLSGASQIYFGCPVWGNRGWLGKVYPPGVKTSDFLYHYARQFPAIELNSTFYGVPEPETLLRWKSMVGDEFLFCPKWPQTISHSGFDIGLEARVQQFFEALSFLGGNLGLPFLQLPDRFSPSEVGTLSKILKQIPAGCPTAVEFRHRDWFQNQVLRPEARRLLERFQLATVVTDVPGRRDVVHSTLVSERVLVRFSGHNLHRTDYERIDRWVERLEEWQSQGVGEIYFFIHEPDEVLAPDLVSYFVDGVNKANGNDRLKNWVPYVGEEDVQSQFSFL